MDLKEAVKLGHRIIRSPVNFCDPASSQHHNSGGGGGGGGGGFPLKFFRLVSITATCFSNPQTNLGARRSRRLGDVFEDFEEKGKIKIGFENDSAYKGDT